MSESVLPAVAKSVFTDCKKCGADRYHTVVAHTSSTAAKVKCEVCGAGKTYKLPSARKATARTRVATTRKNSHQDEYRTWMDSHGNKDSIAYSMRAKFEIDQKLEHPKFGLGYVKASQTDKIEVVFQDEVRSLIHNRA